LALSPGSMITYVSDAKIKVDKLSRYHTIQKFVALNLDVIITPIIKLRKSATKCERDSRPAHSASDNRADVVIYKGHDKTAAR
jgi:hypothetical protein